MKDFVVRFGETVFGQFDTYTEAKAFWDKVVRKYKGAVIQDNSK